jgi:hypothetical protein
MLCKSCHYPLKQLSEPRCPECGREFDPNDAETFISSIADVWERRVRMLLFTLCMVVLACFLLASLIALVSWLIGSLYTHRALS